MNSQAIAIGEILQAGGITLFVGLGFWALLLQHQHSERVNLRLFGFGAGAGIIALSVGLLVASGTSIGSLILLILGIVFLSISIFKKVHSHQSNNPGHPGHL